ncbi:DUF4432 family protein [Halomicroarcula sp. GCM10025817]|uniref:DUF4432 family protein n=1 Tax=Haloarcula TaxID=2237 RepID=UPI0023E81834|nr:DUF4432 family protein [Halomicroarcula sp. SYNS111]
MVDSWDLPRISTDYSFRGIDTAFLENEALRIQVLPGKGGDIIEFRDKRTDTDVLWHADHNWQPPSNGSLPAASTASWLDHYPGGWQMNLPIAGFGRKIEGSEYGLHGESALIPWNARVVENSDEAVALELTTELVRYPFECTRQLRLPRGASRLEIAESITNRGGVELEYIWQQHVTLAQPLLGPAARLDIPAERGVTQSESPAFANGRLQPDATFQWPDAPTRSGGRTDLREIPAPESGIHDQCYATDLEAGWYALTNPEIDLGFALSFPVDPFECIWYWQPLGGFHESPYFKRNYNVGLEPTTAYPSGDLPDAQRANGTMDTLGPGETVSASFVAHTFGGHEAVTDVSDTSVDGR